MLIWFHETNTREAAYQGGSSRDINLEAIGPIIPRQIIGEEPGVFLIASEATEFRVIGVQHDTIRAGILDADAVIGEAVCGVEVEDPEEAGALEDEDLVALMFQADVSLRRMQPAVFLLRQLHGAVELVEEFVSQEAILGQVQLAACVPE